MPKSPKSRAVRRHNPLSEDLVASGPQRNKTGPRTSRREDATDENYVDSKSSRRILEIGRELADEDQHNGRDTTAKPLYDAFTFDSRLEEDGSAQEADPSRDEDDGWGDEEVVEEEDMDPNDMELFNRFMPTGDGTGAPRGRSETDEAAQGEATNLADLILEKIAAHEAAEAADAGHPAILGGGPPEDAIELPAKVVEVFTQIGLLLSRYKSGKLPKPFKVLPTLPNWEDLLFLTRPESWTPNACYEATKIFASGKPWMTQRFLEMVILERVREDIHETKKLNVHLYQALKKALYKPAAFFKGFLFPLVGRECTLREAHIVSSVLARVSVPVLHSAAALLRLCDIAAEQTSVSTEAGGATNIFIQVLLEKKYALPYKVIDALVFHFLRFRGNAAVGETPSDREGKLPVLWHQCLLAFSQRYRNDITEDQREALLDLLLAKGHGAIGPEVRRELLAGRARGVWIEEASGDGGDDTMMMVDGS
ncbi:MAG: snoRNA-binding rRNA-processing protein [Thelocarpon superellum]|nr:MAG: snoRNA-binding rRNA-processing protein [Thelocarpon superellum]